MSVASKLKNLTKSPSQRLLEKYELVDNCGEMTADYKNVLWEKLRRDYEDVVVEELKDLDAEEKKAKK